VHSSACGIQPSQPGQALCLAITNPSCSWQVRRFLNDDLLVRLLHETQQVLMDRRLFSSVAKIMTVSHTSNHHHEEGSGWKKASHDCQHGLDVSRHGVADARTHWSFGAETTQRSDAVYERAYLFLVLPVIDVLYCTVSSRARSLLWNIMVVRLCVCGRDRERGATDCIAGKQTDRRMNGTTQTRRRPAAIHSARRICCVILARTQKTVSCRCLLQTPWRHTHVDHQ